MNRKLPALFLLLFALAVVWWFRHTAASNATPPSPTTSAPTMAAERPAAPDLSLPIADPAAYADLHAPSSSARDDLRIVESLIQNYLTSLKAGDVAPPMGFNEEITRALTGRNPLRVAFLPGNHPAIDAQGRLCDRWGTPYFFHPQSALVVEIRSAGPDKKLFNEDDVSFSTAAQ
jgi:hypothetical protein